MEENKDIQYFDKMVEGADRLIKPWKTAVIGLLIALVVSNGIWAAVHFYAIFKAYQEPTTYEYTQTQDQDGSTQNQDASGKGGGN